MAGEPDDESEGWVDTASVSTRLLVALPADRPLAIVEALLEASGRHLAALVLEAAPTTEQAGYAPSAPALAEVVRSAHGHGCAVLLAGTIADARALPVDGMMLDGAASVAAARASLGRQALIGVGCGLSRHEAMVAGEGGADFIVFGAGSGAPADANPAMAAAEDGGRHAADDEDEPAEGHAGDPLELASWWQELFVLPCAVGGITTAPDARRIAEAGVDFVLAHHDIWDEPEPLSRIRMLTEAIASVMR